MSDDDRRNVLKYSRGLDEVAGRMIFAGDQLIERDVVSDQLKKRGVIFQPLERAMVEHADLFRKHFMSQPAVLGSAKFAALHKALVSSGTFLFVPRGVEIELPIEIFHWLRGENVSVFPHLLLVADELAKVTVIEHFNSCDKTRGRLRLWRERSHRRTGRESYLRLRANLGRKRARIADEHDDGRSRCVRDESQSASRRKIFAVRKSEPLGWRRRPQRSPRRLSRDGRTGIRRAHAAGPHFSHAQRAISFTRMRSMTMRAAHSAVSFGSNRTPISPMPTKKCAIFF